MNANVIAAIKQICHEKNIPYEVVIETIEAALAAAYRKDFGQKNQNIRVKFDAATGDTKVFDVKTVVPDELFIASQEEEARRAALGETKEDKKEEEVKEIVSVEVVSEEEEKKFNPKTDIPLLEAQKVKPDAVLDEEIVTELEKPADYGRMAAQTAKQVITQRLREAERDTVFEEYKGREKQVVMGTVQRIEGRMVFVDIGRAVGILPPEGQVNYERYKIGARIRVYILVVRKTPKGAEVVLSRRHPEIVRDLFMTEIPEIASGVIEIKAISRDAGSRSKIAVYTEEENIDPIGSCVGQRGMRVQTIINELSGEKIDIIKYSEELSEFVANALLPAKVKSVKIKSMALGEGEKNTEEAEAVVPSDQLSLAIGKDGQNVRLAGVLTNCKINIVEEKSDNSGNNTVKEEGATEPTESAARAPKPEENESEENNSKEVSASENDDQVA